MCLQRGLDPKSVKGRRWAGLDFARTVVVAEGEGWGVKNGSCRKAFGCARAGVNFSRCLIRYKVEENDFTNASALKAPQRTLPTWSDSPWMLKIPPLRTPRSAIVIRPGLCVHVMLWILVIVLLGWISLSNKEMWVLIANTSKWFWRIGLVAFSLPLQVKQKGKSRRCFRNRWVWLRCSEETRLGRRKASRAVLILVYFCVDLCKFPSSRNESAKSLCLPMWLAAGRARVAEERRVWWF